LPYAPSSDAELARSGVSPDYRPDVFPKRGVSTEVFNNVAGYDEVG